VTDLKYYKNTPEAEEDEPLFDVSYSPEEGDLVVFVSRPRRAERERRSILRRLGIVDGAAATPIFTTDDRVMGASRAFHAVRRYAVRNDLRTHATLKYDDQVEARRRRRHLSGAMKKMRRQVGRFPYIAVHEQGDVTSHVHWHVLLPAEFDQTLIEEAWEHGEAFVTRAPSYPELETLVDYVANPFFEVDAKRLFSNRYTRARGFDGARLTDEGLTRDDVDILLQQLTGANYDTVVYTEAPNPFVVATYRWNPLHVPRGQ
jgi:hypothetical protein